MNLDLFNPSRYLRRMVLVRLSILLGVISGLLGIYNLFISQLTPLGICQLLFSTLSAWIFFKAKTNRHGSNQVRLYASAFLVVVSVESYVQPVWQANFIWAFLFPAFFYLLLGKREGLLATSVAIAVQCFIIFPKTVEFLQVTNTSLFMNIALCFVCVWVAVHIFEDKRMVSETSLGQLASRDALTGVYNRHALIHNFTRYRQESEKVPLSLLILDLDYFKQVNDKHGHDVGDKVLVQAAGLIDSLCDEHLVYRIGGEEFCVALHNTSLDKAKTQAELLRASIEQYEFNNHQTPINITSSIGVYQCDHFRSLEDVLKRADVELYKAKQNGRNQVMVSEPA